MERRAMTRCVIIAGPNGAGETTFAREFLPKAAGILHFVNADLIASGLSPLRPELAAFAAGRILLTELDRLARARVNFAFETTLTGLTYLNRHLRLAQRPGRRREALTTIGERCPAPGRGTRPTTSPVGRVPSRGGCVPSRGALDLHRARRSLRAFRSESSRARLAQHG